MSSERREDHGALNRTKRAKLSEETEGEQEEVEKRDSEKKIDKESKASPLSREGKQKSFPIPVKTSHGVMLEVILNDRLGKKIKVKCNSDDTVGDLKKLVAAQIGTRAEKLRIQKFYTVFKDHITLEDYEVQNGMSLELYYN